MTALSSSATSSTVETPAAPSKGFITSSILRILTLVLLCSVAALYESTQLSSLSNTDIWIHLRTGSWILQNLTVPHNGLFSQSSSLPWSDSTWGFDLIAGIGYKLIGLRTVPFLLMAFQTALALITFLLTRARHSSFWLAVFLSAVAQYVIPLQPSPFSCSILFFGIELMLLEQSHRSGSVRHLFWLPPLFFVWANLHSQFVLGLLLLGLFIGSQLLERALERFRLQWLEPSSPGPSIAVTGFIAASSLVAALLTPYVFHSFAGIKALYSGVAFEYFEEMRAMSFRRPQEFVLMLLVMAAFLALGRKRSAQPVLLLVLVVGTALAFRIQRDAWAAVLPAIAILGTAFAGQTAQSKLARPRWHRPVFVILLMVAFLVAAKRVPDQSALLAKSGRAFPVKACDFIRDNQLQPPLFNAYTWGGFIAWYLPQYPVSIDSRTELFGDQNLDQYFKLSSGNERLDAVPNFVAARTLLLETKSGMAKAQTTLPELSSQFKAVYRDDLATVLVRQ